MMWNLTGNYIKNKNFFVNSIKIFFTFFNKRYFFYSVVLELRKRIFPYFVIKWD